MVHVSNGNGPVVQPGMNAAFASSTETGGGRGFKSRPVHHLLGSSETRSKSFGLLSPKSPTITQSGINNVCGNNVD